MHCCSTLELIFFCQKQMENQSDRKFISHVSTLNICKLSNVVAKEPFNVETVRVKILHAIWSPNNFIPPIFGNLSFSWRYAKIRNKSTVRFVKNPLHVHTCVHMCTMYVLTRHYSTSGISRISFSETLMPPLECSFRTISILLTVPCGRSVGHALQGQTSTDRQRPRIFLLNQPDRCFH